MKEKKEQKYHPTEVWVDGRRIEYLVEMANKWNCTVSEAAMRCIDDVAWRYLGIRDDD